MFFNHDEEIDEHIKFIEKEKKEIFRMMIIDCLELKNWLR